MNTFKEQCIALRKRGYSIIQIMKATGRAKSSIRLHIKDIPLSKERVQQYRIAAGKRIRKFALARKGKSIRPFTAFSKWTPDMVALTAHLIFDGSIFPRNGCVYNNRSTALLQKVETLMSKVYAFEPSRYTNPTTGVHRISYHNVALAGYFKIKSAELVAEIRSLSNDSRKAFLQAFFDDEGCIDYRPNESRRSIRGYQKNVKILKLIHDLLADFAIVSHIVAPNEVVIVGKENLIRFEQEINFSPGIYMNGNRSNSRWKKHKEKRVLLKQAIKSFQT